MGFCLNSDLQRYKLTLAYDGTNYVGWQIQPNGPSIQATLEAALKKVAADASRPVGSGRTDSGVHALGQVAHVGLVWPHPPEALHKALNSLLPADIRVLRVEAVANGFHAQRSTQEKWYRYVVREGAIHESPLLFSRHFAWGVSGPLNLTQMRQAARPLVGRHDFASFQGSRAAVKTTVRTLRRIKIATSKESGLPMFSVEARWILFDFVGGGVLKADGT